MKFEELFESVLLNEQNWQDKIRAYAPQPTAKPSLLKRIGGAAKTVGKAATAVAKTAGKTAANVALAPLAVSGAAEKAAGKIQGFKGFGYKMPTFNKQGTQASSPAAKQQPSAPQLPTQTGFTQQAATQPPDAFYWGKISDEPALLKNQQQNNLFIYNPAINAYSLQSGQQQPVQIQTIQSTGIRGVYNVTDVTGRKYNNVRATDFYHTKK